jgi:integrase
MGSVYRREQNGTRARKWTICYTDQHGVRRVIPGFTDKAATVEKLRQLEIRAARLQVGLPVEAADHENPLWAKALDDYLAELKRLGRSECYLYSTRRHLVIIGAECGWKRVGQINATRFALLLDQLAAGIPVSNQKHPSKEARWVKPPKPRGPGTLNAYRGYLLCFVRFCRRRGWCVPHFVNDDIPKMSLGRPGDLSKRPMARRALTLDEFRRLTRCPKIKPYRRQLYLVAGLSGLRANELRQLEPQDFTLGEKPQWHCRPEITKGKRLDKVPMLPECAKVLAELVEGKGPTDRLFPRRVPCHRFRADLLLAGIERKDHRGRQADFHGLRYTFCRLVGATLPIQKVRLLMRHANIKTTCDIYLDLGIDDVAEQLQTLPGVLQETTPPESQTAFDASWPDIELRDLD